MSFRGLQLDYKLKSPSLPNITRFNSGPSTVTTPTVDAASSASSFGFEIIDNNESEPRSNGLLSVPHHNGNINSNRISNSSSAEHSNASFIDMYGDARSIISDEEEEVEQEDEQQHEQEEQQQNQKQQKVEDLESVSKNQNSVLRGLNDSRSSFRESTNLQQMSSIHSSRKSASRVRLSIEESQTLIKSSRDRYGFKKKSAFISEEQYNSWWNEYSQHCARRKKKWVQFFNKSGLSLNNDNPQRFPAKSEKLKRYVRKGIPAEWRGNAWWYFAKGSEKLNKNIGLYDSLVESTINLSNKDTEIIERDLNRTFPDNIHFRDEGVLPVPTGSKKNDKLETPLVQGLRRVLVAFATYQPHIGYCQSLNFIAGLLLIFMDEERAFWMLVIITSRFLPGVHEINLEGVNIDQGVLMLAVREYLPDTWEKILNINFDQEAHINPNQKHNYEFLKKLPPITLCTSSWFMSIFVGVLPIETTLRVWDCFFYEESNFLFKISLSIFKLIEPEILKLKDEMDIFQLIQNVPKKIIDPSVLFDIIFKKKFGFNGLTQDEINRGRKFVSLKRKLDKETIENYGGKNGNDKNQESDVNFNRKLLDESLWEPDFYGRRGLPGVNWNKNLSRKMRSIRKKRF